MPKPTEIKLKVCGLRDNIEEVAALSPDLVGFIFYNKSPRFLGDLEDDVIRQLPSTIDKVGVFVNSPEEYVLEMVNRYDLQYAQLHGDESPEYCKDLQGQGVKIIKVFGGNTELSNELLSQYASCIDFYLFDTRTDKYGGTGHQFDWNRLKGLNLQKPIFLSGGIDLESIEQLDEIKDLDIYAIDVNSKFEISPGMKSIELLGKLKTKMKGLVKN